MRMTMSLLTTVLLFGASGALPAAEQPAAPSTVNAADKEAAYAAELSKRADGVLEALGLTDPAKSARVRDAVIAQYRGIRAIDEKRDAEIAQVPKDDKPAVQKARADADAARKPLHDSFITTLSADLTPEQVETVKDKMTYNVVKVTYAGFLDMLPSLTEPQKAYVLAQLKEARELAMDQGTSNEKHAVFGKYKGKINVYLSKEGYDLKAASKEWAERRKAREARAKN